MAPLLSAAASIVRIWIMSFVLAASAQTASARLTTRTRRQALRRDRRRHFAMSTRSPSLHSEFSSCARSLRRAAHVLAVAVVLHEALDGDRDRLLHLGADDRAGQRALGARRRWSSRLAARSSLATPVGVAARTCSPSTVFTRAMLRRTLPNWSGFAAWPDACAMRRLNCSRRSFRSSSCSSRLALGPQFFGLHQRTCRLTNIVSTDSFDAARRNASRAMSSVTPSISKSTLPGCTRAT